MARQRKPASKVDSLTSPSKMSPPSNPAKPLIEITEDEQWRLINQSGILQNRALGQEPRDESAVFLEGEDLSLCDEIFNAVLLIIPFSSLLLLMEMYVSHSMSYLQYIWQLFALSLIRHQYGKTASVEDIMEKMLPGVPSMFSYNNSSASF